jgi:hypothetical protein
VKKLISKLDQLSNLYLADSSLENLTNILFLPGYCLSREMTNGKESLLNSRLVHFPNVSYEIPDRPRRAPLMQAPNRLVDKLMSMGRLSASYNLLKAPPLPRPSPELVRATLHDLHPVGAESPFGNRLGHHGLSFSSEELAAVVRSLKNDSAPGPSGWSNQLLKLASQSGPFLLFLARLTQQISDGSAPGQEMLCSSRLVPIPKPNGGIRPIAVGEVFYRTCTKAILKKMTPSESLNLHQFGVGSVGSCEPLFHHVQRLAKEASENENAPPLALVSLDFSNAFNTLDRRTIAQAVYEHCPALYRTAKWAYDQPAPLYLPDNEEVTHTLSSCGVRQGDPLGPFLFSLGVKKKFEAIQSLAVERVGKAFAYLDDVFLLLPSDGDSPSSQWKEQIFQQLTNALSLFQDGLVLNLSKCRVVGLKEAYEEGFSLLGSCVGSPAIQARILGEKKIEEDEVLNRLLQTKKQYAQVLFRSCHFPKWNYHMRTLDPHGTKDVWKSVDEAHTRFFGELAEIPSLSPLSIRMLHLPLHSGGLGIPSLPVVSEAASEASTSLSSSLFQYLEDVQRQPARADLPTPNQNGLYAGLIAEPNRLFLESLSKLQWVALSDFSSKIGRCLVRLLPLEPSLLIPDQAFKNTLRMRLLASEPLTCPLCGAANSAFHLEHCSNRLQVAVTRRHKQLVTTLAQSVAVDRFTSVSYEVKDPSGQTEMAADLVITGRNAHNHSRTAVDVSVASFSSQQNQLIIERTERLAEESPLSYGKRVCGLLREKRETEKIERYQHAFPGLVPVVFLPNGTISNLIGKWLASKDWIYQVSAVLAKARISSL